MDISLLVKDNALQCTDSEKLDKEELSGGGEDTWFSQGRGDIIELVRGLWEVGMGKGVAEGKSLGRDH